MTLSELCEKFLKDNGVNCCSIIENNYIENGEYFSWRGCDCCKNRKGSTVYDCHGYNPESKSIVELGQVCGDCIGYFYNGDIKEE